MVEKGIFCVYILLGDDREENNSGRRRRNVMRLFLFAHLV